MGVGVNFSICPLNTSKKVDISHCSGVTKKSGFSKSLPQLDLSVAQTPLPQDILKACFGDVPVSQQFPVVNQVENTVQGWRFLSLGSGFKLFQANLHFLFFEEGFDLLHESRNPGTLF